MTDDKIAEIRERHTMYPPSRPSSSSRYSFIVAYQDIATLLAEVDRLRVEIKRHREVIRTIRARCVELDDSDAVSETLDIATAVLEDEP